MSIINIFWIILITSITVYIIIRTYPSLLGKKSTSQRTKFNSINNVIDDEHNEIFNALDQLYEKADNHWKTEEKYYNQGSSEMPSDHKDINKEWEDHRKEHTLLLEKIKQMKLDIVKHINEKDTAHFHWLK